MKMVLVDAYSQIFRGFYAIMHLTDSRGEPTNAIFAFAKLLLQLERDYPSTLGAMAFDCGKVAFRLEIAPEYKGNRSPTPPELLAQIPVIRDLAQAFGWPIVEQNNFEADDLIAGAVKHFADSATAIISSDKDLAQLVNEHVSLYRPCKPAGFERWQAAQVVEGFGVRPEQIVDYLSLLGDTADNISGVAGIGKKTAAVILNEVGSLAEFYENPELVSSAKSREKLLAGREIVEKNRKLIALRDDLPEDLQSATVWRRRSPDWAKIREICTQKELKSILKDLPGSAEKVAVDLFA